MSSLHTKVDAWIRLNSSVIRGRPFPYGDFSCTPLTPDEPGAEDNPVCFLLSRGNEVTWVDPQTAGQPTRLWDNLVDEMHRWKSDKSTGTDLPPEYWYG